MIQYGNKDGYFNRYDSGHPDLSKIFSGLHEHLHKLPSRPSASKLSQRINENELCYKPWRFLTLAQFNFKLQPRVRLGDQRHKTTNHLFCSFCYQLTVFEHFHDLSTEIRACIQRKCKVRLSNIKLSHSHLPWTSSTSKMLVVFLYVVSDRLIHRPTSSRFQCST